VLWAYNESYPDGVSATVTVHVVEAVHYVAAGSGNPVAPYSSWATAAANIQDAIDAAAAGALVLVSDGVYQTGGRVADGGMTNRAAVTKPLTVRSVNGPEVTVSYGDRAVRCVYLTNGATLLGFTLTNGAGGVRSASASAVVSNCVLSGNSATYEGGGAFGGTLNNCTLTGNSAAEGGGTYGSTLNNCSLTDNSAQSGGGAAYSTLNNCTLSSNSVSSGGGGGAYFGTLNNCTLTGNSAAEGGGAFGGTLNNCTLSGNSADDGGGALEGTLNNCTLTGNSAGLGGGAYDSTLNNCIVYYNVAQQSGANYESLSSFNYSCTTPLPPGGAGNISSEPQLASTSHLSAGSPCLGAGSAAYATGVDIDGEPWANPPSMGCDELQPGAVTGPLSMAIIASYTNVATGIEVNFTAQISGRLSASRWEFGDGTGVTNRPYTAHGWVSPGDYPVVLWAYNESYPDGASATVTVHVVDHPVHYVALESSNPLAPYISWATARRTSRMPWMRPRWEDWFW
jgi:hypothetical protein